MTLGLWLRMHSADMAKIGSLQIYFRFLPCVMIRKYL